MSSITPADILAVDDNANNLRSLEALLKDVRGARLVMAHSGDEALKCLLMQDFAIILLDIQMPSLDGYETARLIRSRERTRHVPIIFFTALNATEVNVAKGYALGAVDFIVKPIDADILRTKVGVFLELYRKTQEVKRQETLLREAERREHERSMAEARQQYERSLLKEEAERERKVAEALELKAQDLARLVDEKDKAERRLALLASTASALLMGAREKRDQVYHQVSKQFGLEVYVKYRVSGPSVLSLASHAGLSGEALAPLEHIPFGEGIPGVVAENQQRVVMGPLQLAELGDPLARDAGLKAVACYPLLVGDRLLGAILFGTRKERLFTSDEIALLQSICDQVAVSLERDRLIEELHERDRRKDEFLAMLGHELRNPLAPIRNAIEVVRLRAGGGDAKLRRAMESAERQVGHMTRLVDDLLDVSRITRGKVELRPEPTTLEKVVEQAVQATEPSIREHRHTLTVQLPPEPVGLVVDSTRITQVLANLLHNAAKYTPPGGQIALVAERAPGQVVIRVRDNGIGIRPDMLPKIFDIFVQVDPTSDRAKGGLGLGLTLVKSLVEMHDGAVEAHSAGVGKGSEFVVRLPLEGVVEEPEPPPDDVVSVAAPELPPLNILLIEDNPDIRSTMRDLLELHGHTVEEAADGEHGVAMALSHPPHVALVDIGLPGFDGYSVAEKIRASTHGTSPRLVALTGYGTPDASKRAAAAGFDAHLVKPISFEELSRVLVKLVSPELHQGAQ